MNLFVVNEYFIFERYNESGCSRIVSQFNKIEDVKSFVDELQSRNPQKIYSVNDVYNKKIIYRSENGWLI